MEVEREGLSELSNVEDRIKSSWNTISQYIKRSSAYIWSDEVKKNFKKIKKDVKRIEFILTKLYKHYGTNPEEYEKEIKDIENFLSDIKKLDSSPKWIQKIKMDLERIIMDIEGEKNGVFTKRIEQLIKWGFDFDNNVQMGNYLISNWDVTNRIVSTTKPEYSYIIFKFLPKYKRIIQKWGLLHVGEGLSNIANNLWMTKYYREKKLEEIAIVFRSILYDNFQVVNKYGLLDLAELSIYIRKEELKNLFVNALPRCKKIILKYSLKELVEIVKSIIPLQITDMFTYYLPIANHVIHNIKDLEEICIFLAKDTKEIFKTHVVLTLLQSVSSKDEFFRRCELIKDGKLNKTYWTIQGLNSMGFLCCSVKNAYAGGNIFANIINEVRNTFDYNPSISTLKQGKHNSGLAMSPAYRDLKGCVGVIYDYGYIYESYLEDAQSYNIIDNIHGKSYRTSYTPNKRVDTYTSVNEARGEWNELLIRNWTVSGMFYTRGCIQSAIDRLKDISDELSYKEYIYGAYWYRTIKIGTPKHIIKVFPIYEIDLSNNTWNIVYIPKNQNYNVVVEKPNNTYRVIPK